MNENITYLTDAAMITCIAQTGDADTIIQAARDAGATAALVYQGRGMGIQERLGILGIAVDAQKDVITILVSSEQRDIVVNNIYKAGHFDTPARGWIHIVPLEKVATYIPATLKERLQKKT